MRLVGGFIRSRREALGVSQRSLGLLFTPPVTTQFISNVERGVTPLPPVHVPTLAKALQVAEAEIMNLLEKEYSMKLSERLGRQEGQSSGINPGEGADHSVIPGLKVAPSDEQFIRGLYEAYKQADPKTRQTFADVCESLLKLSISKSA